jgi:endonuclease YncB( thermonuclease family)
MIKYLILLLLVPTLCWSEEFKSVLYDIEILRVIDGDTIVYRADFLPPPLKKELSIRVYGVDTPEKGFRSHCDSESHLGDQATQFTKTAVAASKLHQIVLRDWDKYGGRVLGDVLLDGKSLRTMLLSNGLAHEYYGETKQSWCELSDTK